MGISIGLNCPACGGAIQVSEGDNSTNCQYCNSMLFIEGDAGVLTIAFKNKLDTTSTQAVAEQWFRKGWKARDLRKNGKLLEVYPIYLPFWSTRVRVAGWICGYEERHYQDSQGHSRTERIPKEEMVLREYQYSEIACDPGDLGVKKLRNFGGDTTFEDFEMIPTYEATTSKDDAVKRMKEEALSQARREAHVPHVTFEKVHTIAKRTSIIYYPIWVARYSYRDRMYMYTLDGVTGQLISGRAPGDPLFQSLAITAGTSVGGLIAAGGLVLGLSSENSGEVVLVALGIGVAITFGAYLFFRHGSEIIEGDFDDKKYGFSGVKDLVDVGEALSGGVIRGRI